MARLNNQRVLYNKQEDASIRQVSTEPHVTDQSRWWFQRFLTFHQCIRMGRWHQISHFPLVWDHQSCFMSSFLGMFLLQSLGVLALNPWLGRYGVRIIQSWSNNMKIVHDCPAVRSHNAMGWLLSFQDAWLCRDCCARYGRYIDWFAAPSLPRSLRCCVPRRLRGRSFWQMQRQTGRPLVLWCSKDWRNDQQLLDNIGYYW